MKGFSRSFGWALVVVSVLVFSFQVSLAGYLVDFGGGGGGWDRQEKEPDIEGLLFSIQTHYMI